LRRTPGGVHPKTDYGDSGDTDFGVKASAVRVIKAQKGAGNGYLLPVATIEDG
jgi:hypothetical protein